ncbi:MAG: ferritin-like domain-containing protein [Roseateles sp.]
MAGRHETTREELLHLLAEASELEHNLLCSYLFALFSLKRRHDEDLRADEYAALQRWRKQLLSVCVEEMLHLTQVANLTAALGAAPHFNRPNLPVAPGYHPAEIVVGLTPLSAETLKHFIFLERPESVALEDPEIFSTHQAAAAQRDKRPTRLIPSAPDYTTIGEFYGVLRRALQSFVDQQGDTAFRADAYQLDGRLIDAPSVTIVRSLDDAVQAIDRIVEQGEGASQQSDDSHYARFSAMLKELTTLQAARPGFQPARNVGMNPVMRPPQAAERTHVTSEPALACLDAFNAVYWLMLRTLAALYANGQAIAKPMVNQLLACMHLLSELADPLTECVADAATPGVMAGPSFTVPRHTEAIGDPRSALQQLRERCAQIETAVALLPISEGLRAGLARKLAAMRQSLECSGAQAAAGLHHGHGERPSMAAAPIHGGAPGSR